jgi:H+/gluconate symporter-like permease
MNQAGILAQQVADSAHITILMLTVSMSHQAQVVQLNALPHAQAVQLASPQRADSTCHCLIKLKSCMQCCSAVMLYSHHETRALVPYSEHLLSTHAALIP